MQQAAGRDEHGVDPRAVTSCNLNGKTSSSNRGATRTKSQPPQWALRCTGTRAVPVGICGIFIVVTYDVVGHVCVEYLLRKQQKIGLVATFITLYFLVLFLMLAPWIRIIYTVQRDPGLVPLINNPASEKNGGKAATKKKNRLKYRMPGDDIEEGRSWVPPDTNPDSPGLEAFYSKEVFVCEVDGRPRWCSGCKQWKPDRAHHSSELGRCVRKMDHLCPWVGGMVAENTFNFFTQFTFWCTLYCSLCLAVGIYTLQLQQKGPTPEILDGWVIALIVLAGFFLLFASGMALTSMRYIFINITNIDMLKGSQKHFLAVRIPWNTPPSSYYPTIVYPLAPLRPNGHTVEWHPEQQESVPDGRDQLAKRRFAILQTKSGENPWHLGYGQNWTDIMGTNVMQWLLPIRHSPCCRHDDMESDYKLGPVLAKLKKRYGIAETLQSRQGTMDGGIEMRSGV